MAAAEPESFYPFTTYNTGLVHPGLYNYNFGVRTYSAGNPVVKSGNFHTNLQNIVDGSQPAVAGQVYQPVQRFAREAESDSFYPTIYSNVAAYNTLGYNNLGYNNLYHSGLVNPAVNYLNARTYWPSRIYKREAESDSESFYPFNTYNAFTGVRNVIPSTYTYPTVATRYNVPVVNSVVSPAYQRLYTNQWVY